MGLFPAAVGRAQPTPQPTTRVPEQLSRTLRLGVGDQFTVQAPEAEEIGTKPYFIDSEGNATLPLVGKIAAAGLTLDAFESELKKALKMFYRDPQVIVSLVQVRSDPVFFVGAFQKPGIYSLQGNRTVIEVLTSIGGLAPHAGRRIRLVRRREFGDIPLRQAVADPDGKSMSVAINLGGLRHEVDPNDDILLRPYDTITAERAEMVYVSGEVGKVGPVELSERDSISITQLLSIAGGLRPDADPKRARILRPVLDTNRRAEIPIDLRRVLSGQASDFPLLANDVLHVPRDPKHKYANAAALVAVPLITTLLWVVLR